jgi:hypothetical protein
MVKRFYLAVSVLFLLFSIAFFVWPREAIVAFLIMLALKVSSARVAYIGMPRVEAELIFVTNKLKVFLPILGVIGIGWGSLWHIVDRMPQKVSVSSEIPVLSAVEKPPAINHSVMFLLLLLAFFTRLWQFDQSFFFDEIYAITHAINSSGFLKSLYSNLNTAYHIFYSFISHVLFLIFGDKFWIYRGPALIFGLLGITFLSKLAGILKSKDIVWVSVLLLIFSPIHVDQSQLARGYTLFILLAIVSSYFFIRAFREGRVFLWLGFFVATVLGFYTHLYMAMVFFSQFLSVLLGLFVLKQDRGGARQFFFYSTCSFFAIFLLYLPFMPVIIFDCLRNYPHDAASLKFFISLLKTLGPGETGPDTGLIHFVLAAAGLFFLWRIDRFFAIFGIILLILPIAVVCVTKPVYLFARYFVFMLPFYLIFIAAAICGISKKVFAKKPNILIGFFLILIFILDAPSLYFDSTHERQPYAQAAAFIKKTFSATRSVIAPGFAGGSLSYYLKDRPVIEVSTIDETRSALTSNPSAIFLITYRPTIESDIISFVDNNYKCLVSYPGRVSSVAVYGRQ